MTRRPRNWIRPRSDDDGALDALLAGAWEDGAATVAGLLGIEAGKAALLAAAGAQHSAGAAGHATTGQDTAVAAVCDEAGQLLATVTGECGHDHGPAHSAVMAQTLAARQFLIQLRAGLERRALAKAGALHLAGGAAHALEEAARTVRRLPPPAGGPAAREAAELLELISGLRERLRALSGMIERLFDEAGDTAPRVPAPQR